jgi:hypothetical protein
MAEAAFRVSQVPGVPGGVSIDSGSRLWGLEGNGLMKLYRSCWCHADLLAGLRYLDLGEDLNLTIVNGPIANPVFPVPGVLTIADRFETRNQFYGPQIGAKAGVRYRRFSAEVVGKVAFGTVHEVINIAGSRTTAFGGFSQTTPGGVFAQPTNAGRYTRNEFAVVPEVQVQLGVDLMPNLRVFVGYNFLYLSHVVRPGNQIDRAINTTQFGGFPPVAGPAVPQVPFRESDFWAQGINFGVEFRY